MTFGEYLKDLRQAKGISQKELSGLTNGQVSNAEISRLEAGIRKKPSPAVLKILAPHLGVPVGALLTEAGYLDSMPAETGAEAQSAAAAVSAPDSNQLARLQILEEEGASLRAENKRLREESESSGRRCERLEAANKALEATNKELEEKCDYLLIQGRPAGEINSELAEENRVFKEQNEKMKEENRRIKEETIAFLEEGDLLRAETDGYRKKMNLAEDTARKAIQRQGELEEGMNASKAELEMLRAEMEAQKAQAEAALAAAAARASEAGGPAGEIAEQNAALAGEAAELRSLLTEAAARYDKLSAEYKALEKELLAVKEAGSINAPVLNSIRSVTVADMDLGKIFTETAGAASPEDLEMLGRVMQAMNRDAIKASDKRMLMDILKRFVK
ncbi:MAG: helix-turn-helix domain-containing protein [Clostridiales bacterium]|nr:helix-turn-helix domain-containing protein [Clostridiales bacterium]